LFHKVSASIIQTSLIRDKETTFARYMNRSSSCEILLLSCLLMSIRQVALYRDDAGTDWPVPTANIVRVILFTKIIFFIFGQFFS